MQHNRYFVLSSRSRFTIALVATIALHGVILNSLSSMRMAEPHQPRIMVGRLIKLPTQKTVEPQAPVPPPSAPETAKPKPQADKPLQQPTIKKAKPRPKSVRTKPQVSKKPAPRTKPIVKSHPAKTAEPVTTRAQNSAAKRVKNVSSPAADRSPTEKLTPPQFYAEYLHNPQPRYPLMSRKRREEGEVILRVKVDATGQPEAVSIHTSSGHSRLDRAASSAVQKWRFVPARKAGLNVAAWVVVPIQFNLER